METQAPETAQSVTPPQTPSVDPVEAPAAPVEQPSSILEHEAKFGDKSRRRDEQTGRYAKPTEQPSETAQPTPQKTQEAERQRAKSQQARAEDSPRIAELTKKWREAERRAELAEQRAAFQPPTTPPVAAPVAAKFDKPAPKMEDFATADNPIEAWVDARDTWRDEKRAFEQQQHSQDYARQQALAKAQEVATSHHTRVAAFTAKQPDFEAALERSEQEFGKIPDILGTALVIDDNGPELMYYLATHPDELADLALVAANLEPDESSVELLRRRLSRYVRGTNAPAIPASGALPPAQPPVVVAPRPPTPLRTGPMKTGEDTPREGDILGHAKHYDPQKRFRAGS